MQQRYTFLSGPSSAWCEGQESRKSHSQQVATLPLREFISTLDLDFSKLSHDQLSILVAARNCLGWLQGLSVHVAKKPQEDFEAIPLQIELNETFRHTKTREIPTVVPTEVSNVADAEGIEDLDLLLPEEWAIFGVDRDEFTRRIHAGEALKLQYFEPELIDSEVPEHEHHEHAAPPAEQEELVYVLLDTSQTMGSRDKRGIVSSGLALAFLIRGLDQGTRLNFRNFTSQVGELESGYGISTLKGIAKVILELPKIGMTNIPRVLETAAADIASNPKITGAVLALITDGISKLPDERPFSKKIELHSYLIGDIEKTTHPADWKAVKEELRKLKRWCFPGSHTELHAEQLRDALKPSVTDLASLEEFVHILREEIPRLLFQEELDRMFKTIDNLKYLLACYSTEDEPLPKGLAALQAEIESLHQELRKQAEQNLLSANKANLDQEEFARREARRELAKLSDQEPNPRQLTWSWDKKSSSLLDRFDELKQLARIFRLLVEKLREGARWVYHRLFSERGD